MTTYSVGMVGLGTMGRNLMLNIADHKHSIIGYDKDTTKVDQVKAIEDYSNISATDNITQFVQSLERPARIILLVPAGKIVDYVISDLTPLLSQGDIIIDGGNSYFKDTDRRYNDLKTKGIHFMGMGVSGGEKGARFGPSIMPSGDLVAFNKVEPILNDAAAKYNAIPCSKYMGNGSAGHYVKMVHNGIEYGMMQLIAETYDIMHNGMNLSNSDIADTFNNWSHGELSGFLIEATVSILRQKDDVTGNDLIDMIKDVARQKGTGKWTSQDALDLQVPVPTIDLSVVARDLSAFEAERQSISACVNTSVHTDLPGMTIDQLGSALHLAFLLTYNQGLHLIKIASDTYQYEVPMIDVIHNWKEGCIIRSALLAKFEKVYQKDEKRSMVITDDDICKIIQSEIQTLKQVVLFGIHNNFGSSAYASVLTYWNMMSSAKSPMNIIQGLRDLFGAHTFERVDKPGVFHQEWN